MSFRLTIWQWAKIFWVKYSSLDSNDAIWSFHFSRFIGIIFVLLTLDQSYCWDFYGWRFWYSEIQSYRKQTSWSSDSYNLSFLDMFLYCYLRFRCRSIVVNWAVKLYFVSCSFLKWFLFQVEVFLMTGKDYSYLCL